MNSKEIQNNVQAIVDNFSKEEFIYDLLMAYGTTKTVTTMLKKGDYNLSKVEGEVLSKNKVFFKVEESGKLLSTIDTISKEDRILKHKPKFAILTDYKQLVAKDLRFGTTKDIQISELANHHSFFLPLAGSEVYNSNNDNEADRDAAYKMAEVYDELRRENPEIYKSKESIHHLNIFLSRLLFCFFAEDTEIFDEESIFTNTLAQHTNPNGSDTHVFLNDLFKRLNTEKKDGLPDYLIDFPYVNGGLFKDPIKSPKFSSKARKVLLELGDLDWKDINPDIFGSMIQAVVIDEYRSDLGMHYTSVPNILKVIKPLFLDELYEEYEKHENSIPQLRKLINRISKIKFFDPACGSGNFLIITYKEIRVLEIKILKQIIDLSPTPQLEFTQIRLSQFYGIELDDFAHEMAILALWLAEHQMNRIFEEQLFDYGKSEPILPLKEAGQIKQGNATRENWKEVCPIDLASEIYIIGNPPYLGSRNQDENQKEDLDISISMIKSYRKLDYISIWFYKSAKYIQGFENAKSAFVSTNSICQGEQVGILWTSIFEMGIEFDFAHTDFKWTNNAKGNAGVTVVIIGLRNLSKKPKYLITDGIITKTQNISPNLENGVTKIIKKQTKPLSNFPEMRRGNMPNDKQFLRISKEEKDKLLIKYPSIDKIIKKQVGSDEFINNLERYCYWISEENLAYALTIPEVKLAIDNCYDYRINSKDKTLHIQASRPHQFREFFECNDNSLLIPIVSSENREYIPIGFVDRDTIIPNSAQVIYDANSLIFGILTSKMHNVWVKFTAGRLENRFRYSIFLCYNTFPFPNIDAKQKENLNQYVFDILDERAKHTGKTMAWLYNPDTMPKGLKKAHKNLDEAVEKCYRLQEFKNDTERLEYLFKLYETMVKKDTLFAKQKKTRKTKSKK
ncbi:class I SAM-dependent DNA methyltransferase [Lacinutrix sp. C3R15]|uniref:DNA methyltransferase n=1 Tax=Flavobacteriaceae TaxID=49546 RepID=UPI001C08506D|nr:MULTISPECIES: DNA methyltransferase [Flavobacteriaceae]MBU2939848.1 class I SAM-dependent DNA methyltransferase [Lacinutrix sp. C3R15]MDO6623164.1 class I SAM-dependent DNA methyltransferase [Oceanihabitans sp. 1_MG-2023]